MAGNTCKVEGAGEEGLAVYLLTILIRRLLIKGCLLKNFAQICLLKGACKEGLQ
jgi:hypothetical protein